MARKRNRRLRRIAQQTAELQVMPQRQQLNMALDEAASARDQGIRGARATGAGLRGAIKASRPAFRQVYGDAGRRLEANRGIVNANMPGATSGPAAAILAAAAAEQQAAENANTTARRDTLNDLTQQGIRAQEGQAFAVRNAQQQYTSDVGKILQQLLGLSAQEGKYAAAEFGRLRENALDRDVRRATQKETARHNKASEGETARHNKQSEANQRASANGKKFATDAQHGALGDKITEATHWARLLAKGGASREAIEHVLAVGRPSQTVYRMVDDGRGGQKRVAVLNPDGSEKKTADVPRLGSGLFVEAALDQVFKGHATRRTTRRLHQRGFLIRKLPVTSFAAWNRRNQKKHPRTGGHPSQGAAGYPYGPGAGQVH